MSWSINRIWKVAGGIAIAGVLLVPASYLAGWMAGLSRVKPELIALTNLRQQQALAAARQPSEPPGQTAMPQAVWTESSTTLTWAKVPTATHYTIYRARGPRPFSDARAIGTVSTVGRSASYTDNTVAPGSFYTYWIAADNGAGQGPVSPPLTVHTYLSWSTIARRAESGATLAREVLWRQSLLGLFGSSSHSYSDPVWEVNGRVLTVSAAPASPRSTWLVQRGVRWTSQGHRIASQSTGPLVQLTGVRAPINFPSGPSTQDNLAVWHTANGWRDAVLGKQSLDLPSRALILNGYGQVVGLTSSQGHLTSTAP